ncbi:MAG: hypothetical protein IPK60_15210 [Sandaracinaceae bacterium]|jgi:hypothetical protein|nr:hypothetical protein [Sandaracinaceae bacterium]
MADPAAQESKPAGNALLLLFLLLPLSAIVGLVYLVQRLFFSSEELARFNVMHGRGETTFEAAANDELDVRMDIRSDRQLNDASFGEMLIRGDLRFVLTAPDGTAQTVQCHVYNGWTETTHSRERLRRPFFEGAQNDCALRARKAGTHRLRVEIDWRGAPVRSALVRVLK